MKMRLRARVFLGWFGFFVCTASFADPIDFQKWFSLQQQRSLKALFQNISPEGTAPGSVIASPSRRNPDYYFHWIRDSALTMSVVADFAQKTRFLDSRMKSLQVLNEYAAFSRRNQLTPNRSGSGNPEDLLGLGEPKFQVDGKSFDGDWARPQSDGPALRALALMKFARILIQQGKESYVREYLYDGQLPSNTVIKTDLDYVSRFWRAKTFDLWEETPGDHFYTRMVQRKALLEGTRFAEDMKDLESAKWYRGQTQSLTAEIKKHWNPTNGKIYPTLNRVGGLYDKPSALDSAVILGVLHGDTGDGYFGPTDERVLSTAYQLKDTFRRLYVINQNDEIPDLASIAFRSSNPVTRPSYVAAFSCRLYCIQYSADNTSEGSYRTRC
jgi:glucoamylase